MTAGSVPAIQLKSRASYPPTRPGRKSASPPGHRNRFSGSRSVPGAGPACRTGGIPLSDRYAPASSRTIIRHASRGRGKLARTERYPRLDAST